MFLKNLLFLILIGTAGATALAQELPLANLGAAGVGHHVDSSNTATDATAMDPLQYHLELVIYQWSGMAPKQYVIDAPLRSLWENNVGLPWSDGAHRFRNALLKDDFFKSCMASHSISLDYGELICGWNNLRSEMDDDPQQCGDLQTIRQVYNRLLSCDPPN